MTQQAVQEWKCKICKATATITLAKPTVYNTLYPAETGPYSERQIFHDCPVRNGLLSEGMEAHPNAELVV